MIRSTTLPRIARDRVGASFVVFVPKDDDVAPKLEAPAEGIDSLDDEALAEFEAKAAAAFQEIATKEFPTDADVEEAERLAGLVTDARTEQGGRAEAAAERRAKLSGLGEQLSGPDDAGDDEEGDDEDVDTSNVPDDARELEGEDTDAKEPALTASGRPTGGARTRAADLAPRQKKPAPPARRPISLVAAADAPEMKPGQSFDGLMDVADAVGKRASEYPTTPFPGEQRVRMRNGIAVLRKDYEPALIAKAVTDSHVIDYAIDQKRLPGGNLIAAGGWCAPSETLYDLAEYEGADALVDLPEINVARGGIRFTPGPDFRSIFDGTGFSQTEAQAIAGQTKPCYRVDCPPFQEERAGVEGLCITAGILQNKAYPELTARVIRGALAAHAHRISAKTIAKMVALATAVPTLVPIGSGAATPVLNAVELAVEDVKYRHRMTRPTVLEAVFPAWILPAMRADLGYRGDELELISVADAQLKQWFTDRKIAPQFVYDWQDSALGQAAAAATWPATVSFLIYPAGTYVRGMGDVISLDTVYDSAGLVENEFTGLFTEESLLVAKTGHDSRVYTLPIRPDGWNNLGYASPAAPANVPANGI